MSTFTTVLFFTFLAFTPLQTIAQTKNANPKAVRLTLTQTQASRFAMLALKCVRKEYPNKIEHVIDDVSQVQSPKSLHPAFFGCYDWHSSVHGHWLLVHLLRLYPNLPEAKDIREALNANLTVTNIAVEVAYFKQADRQSFERTYGWAWLLKLTEELRFSQDTESQQWARTLQPLADAVVEKYTSFLPKQTYAIRTGVHPNTAFGLAFAFDYAKAVGDQKLEKLIAERSRTYFSRDVDYPASWEPSGEDFLSPGLVEADLMRRVLSPTEFRQWFHRFLPNIASGQPVGLLHPATVTDRSDPKLVHLDGLNLSRAWCMRNIAFALSSDDHARKVLAEAARAHAEDALAHVATGDYAGEHWLATFAVYMLSTLDTEFVM